MPAAITDLLSQVTASNTARPIIDTLANPGKPSTGNSGSITISSGANWPTATPIYFSIYNTQTLQTSSGATAVKDPASQSDWKGILSGTTISQLVFTGGNDRTYTQGAIIELTPTHRQMADLYTWGTTFADVSGNLKSTAVATALGIANQANSGWNPVGQTPVFGTNNGNKETTITVPTDLTPTLSVGMKAKLDRAVAAPTQSMSFTAASSQYATKASPTGITFTGAFTCEAWVYLNSYAAGGIIISRNDTTNGWYFGTQSTSGQIKIGYEAAGAYTEWATYQSIPLKRWVHVAGVISSPTGKTLQGIYINGTSVPTIQNNSAAASLVQGGNLSISTLNTGSTNSYLDGYLTEVRVWSTAQSQAQVQANMAIALTGSETNLVALFQGNGNFNDKTANANNLTATNGAIATYADNPYKTTEYGVVTKLSYAAPNTTITLFTGTDYNIPNQTLTNFQYSTQRAPYGFPNDRAKWVVDAISNGQTITSPSSGTWYAVGSKSISLPAGAWSVRWQGAPTASRGTAGPLGVSVTLSTSTTAETDNRYTAFTYGENNTYLEQQQTKVASLTLSSQTTYWLLARAETASYAQLGIAANTIPGSARGPCVVEAECAYI